MRSYFKIIVQLEFNFNTRFKIYRFFSRNSTLIVDDVISLSLSACMHLVLFYFSSYQSAACSVIYWADIWWLMVCAQGRDNNSSHWPAAWSAMRPPGRRQQAESRRMGAAWSTSRDRGASFSRRFGPVWL